MSAYFQGYKKGNALLDGVTIVVILVVLGIISIYGAQVFDEVNSDLQADDSIGDDAKNLSGNLEAKYSPVLDSLFVLAFVLLCLFIIVSVFFIDTHPIFFIVSILTLIILFILSILLGNVTEDILSDDTLSAYANEHTFTSWILQHLLEISIALGFITGTVMFLKFKGG